MKKFERDIQTNMRGPSDNQFRDRWEKEQLDNDLPYKLLNDAIENLKQLQGMLKGEK